MTSDEYIKQRLESRPSRARELKPYIPKGKEFVNVSRPSRARELKRLNCREAAAAEARRAPRGRVN